MKAKKTIYSIAGFAGLLCLGQSVQAQSFNPPWDDVTGYHIVYDDRNGYDNRPGTAYWDGGFAGTDLTGFYPLDELITLTSDYYTFDFLPETNKYYNGGSGGASFWQNGAGSDGGKYLESLTYWGRTVLSESYEQMHFTINSNTFDTNRYEFEAFIRVVDVNTGHSLVETNLNLNGVTSGFYTLSLAVDWSYVGAPLQAGFRVLGTNANPANAAAYGGANVTVDNLGCWGDPFPPSPDPMTWEIEPYTISDDKIGMTATTATHPANELKYRFLGYLGTTIPGGGLGYDSGWVSDPHHVASGLLPSQSYAWRINAMVDLPCQQFPTGYSLIKSATTLATDTTAPTPNPAEIVSAVASPISVWLTATPATDASLVEYNFVPTGTNGTASGWQASNEYVDYYLQPERTCEYTVQVRDLSAATNTTALSTPASATTPAAPGAGSLTNDLKGFIAGNSTQGSMVHELAMAGFELASLNAAKAVYVDGTGMIFGDILDQTFESRNVLRTIASDYGAYSFTITVTCNSYSNEIEQVCFVGAGQGLQGQYNIPDFFLTGVNGVEAEVKSAGVNMWSWVDGTAQATTNEAGVVTLVNKVRLTYDSTNETVLLEVDWDADGAGGFVSDQTLGPQSTTNVWQSGAPQKVYIAGGAGVTMYDLEIVALPNGDPGPFDLSIVSVSGDTATLQWTGFSGQIYDVVYKTNVGAATWTADPVNTGIPGVTGPQSTTSTVVGDEVFYRIETY